MPNINFLLHCTFVSSSWAKCLGDVASGFHCFKTHFNSNKKMAWICFLSNISIFVFQSLSCVWFFMTPCTAAHQASLSFTISWSLLKLMCIELVMLSNHLILCHSLLLPSIFSSTKAFSNESALHIRWPKYWSFSFKISPSNEYSGLIAFRTDWFDLLAVQGTLKSSPTPQFKSINSLALSFLYSPSSHIHAWLLEKP